MQRHIRRNVAYRVLWAVFSCSLACCAATTASAIAGSATTPATQPSSGDAAADLVALFYDVLLQEQSPTIEQERALFPPVSALRARLVLRGPAGGGEDREPMARTEGDKLQRRLLEQKVAAAGPVVLEYFRRHKEWFLPMGMKSPNEIQISALGHFVRTAGAVKEKPNDGDGFVIALFSRDRAEHPSRFRTVLFSVAGWKIDPDDIRLDGCFDGKTPFDAIVAGPDEGAVKDAPARPGR